MILRRPEDSFAERVSPTGKGRRQKGEAGSPFSFCFSLDRRSSVSRFCVRVFTALSLGPTSSITRPSRLRAAFGGVFWVPAAVLVLSRRCRFRFPGEALVFTRHPSSAQVSRRRQFRQRHEIAADGFIADSRLESLAIELNRLVIDVGHHSQAPSWCLSACEPVEIRPRIYCRQCANETDALIRSDVHAVALGGVDRRAVETSSLRTISNEAVMRAGRIAR